MRRQVDFSFGLNGLAGHAPDRAAARERHAARAGKAFDHGNGNCYHRGFVGGVPERSKGADCKSVGSAFEGSNPSPSTNRDRRNQKTGSSCLAVASDAGRGCARLRHSDLRLLTRGCSSMVEQKPSKLTTRVRFPSPAPWDEVTSAESESTFARDSTWKSRHDESRLRPHSCPCSSVVEHSLGKGEVERSIRSMGTTNSTAEIEHSRI